MKTRTAALALLCGFLIAGTGLSAHHAVAGVYDLNKEVTLEGRLDKLNFTNPHASIEMSVPNPDGTVTHWKLTTASVANLTRQDGVDFLALAPEAGVVTKINRYPLSEANQALSDLRAGRFEGAAVLIP